MTHWNVGDKVVVMTWKNEPGSVRKIVAIKNNCPLTEGDQRRVRWNKRGRGIKGAANEDEYILPATSDLFQAFRDREDRRSLRTRASAWGFADMIQRMPIEDVRAILAILDKAAEQKEKPL